MATSRIYELLWSFFRVQLRRAGMIITLPVGPLSCYRKTMQSQKSGRHHASSFRPFPLALPFPTISIISISTIHLIYLTLSLSSQKASESEPGLSQIHFPLPTLPALTAFATTPFTFYTFAKYTILFFYFYFDFVQVRCRIPLRLSNLLY